MHILLTNDDGIFAPGLIAAYKQLVNIGDVTVVAPSDGKSGASHSITFAEPIVCSEVNVNGIFTGYSIDGSPADCVKLAAMQLCSKPIDLVVAGINYGANVGINIYYSGTVAAAMEAAFLNIPSAAVSAALEENVNFTNVAEYAINILKKALPIEPCKVININIPRLGLGKPKGTKVVPQSTEGFHEHYIQQQNQKGQTLFQLAGGIHRDQDIDTDTVAIADGYITITSLSPGMTDMKKNEQLKKIKW
ncbi:MAG: 5'/3'-nucleotidase SurE [Phycisphaerae bacterium]|nr:5'/3'-nucleotidase SurE [Phycisphaerae bacterium]